MISSVYVSQEAIIFRKYIESLGERLNNEKLSFSQLKIGRIVS